MSRCPLCSGAAGRPAFPYLTHWNGRLFQYLDCRDCRATFVDPLPSSNDFDALYHRSAYHDVHYSEVDPSADYEDSLAFMRKHVTSGAKLLDFGCGNGAFLIAAHAAGYPAQGIEQGESSIALAQENSRRPVYSLDEAFQHGERFDVIYIADVLEHLPKPAETLRQLQHLLAPGGHLFVEGPLEKQRSLVRYVASGFKVARRALGIDRAGTHEPFHLTLTNWESQRHFFERVMDYDCVAATTFETGWPYASRGKVHSVTQGVKKLIADAAVAASRTATGRRLRFANRFRALLKPRTTATRNSIGS